MAEVEQVTLIRTHLDAAGYTRGAEAVARANELIASSGAATAASAEGTKRRVEDVGRAYERLARSYDPAIRGQERYERDARTFNAALERGIISAETFARRLDQAAQRHLGMASAAERAANAQQAFNRTLGVRDPSADATAARAADIAAYGQELDRLRARFVPLAREQQAYRQTLADIAQAERAGALTAAEASAARQRTKDAFAAQVVAMRGVKPAADQAAEGTRLAAHQVTNLSYQVQDAAVQLAGGQNPLLVLMQQGPQATAAVGGVRNAMTLLASAITPTRLAVLGLGLASGGMLALMESTERRVAALRNQLRGYQADFATLAREIERGSRQQAINLPLFSRSDIDQVRGALGQILPPELRGQMAELTETILGMGRAMDDIPGAVDLARRAWRDAAGVVDELARQGVRGFNEQVRRQVELLQRSGDHVAAFNLVLATLKGTYADAARDGTEFEKALGRARSEVRAFWDDVRGGVEGAGTRLLGWFADATKAAREFRGAMGNLPVGERLAAMTAFVTGNFNVVEAYRQRGLALGQSGGGASGAGLSAISDADLRDAVARTAAAAGLDPDLLARFQRAEDVRNADGSWRTSRAGAVGPMQVMPGTFAELEQRYPVLREMGGIGDTDANLLAGALYLRERLEARGGDLRQAASDYNAGPGRTDRAIAGQQALPLETINYIGRVAGTYAGQAIAGPVNLAAARGGATPAAATPPAAAPATPAASDQTRERHLGGALRTADRYGPLDPQRERIQADIQGMRQARGALEETNRALRDQQAQLEEGSDDWRALQQRIDGNDHSIRTLTQGIEGATAAQDRALDPVQELTRNLAHQARVQQTAEGAARSLAEAELQAEEAARQRGRPLDDAERAQVRAAALGTLATQYRDTAEAAERNATAEGRIAAAYAQSEQAGRRQESVERAREEVRRTAIAGTEEEARQVNRLADAYDLLALKIARRNLVSRDLPEQRRSIEMLEAQARLAGADENTRNLELSRLRAEQELRRRDPNLVGTPEGDQFIANARRAAELENTSRNLKEFADTGRDVGRAFFEAFNGAIFEGKSWKEVSRRLGDQIQQIFARELFEKPMEKMFEQLFAAMWRGMGGAQGGMGGGAIFSLLGNGITSLFGGGGAASLGPNAIGDAGAMSVADLMAAPIMHGGGYVGDAAPMRAAPVALWREAPRYHGGGNVGVRRFTDADEVPAILRRRELVLNERQQAAVARRMGGGAGGRAVSINAPITIVAPDPNAFRASIGQVTVGAAQALRRATRNM